jgi:hypothetical protein
LREFRPMRRRTNDITFLALTYERAVLLLLKELIGVVLLDANPVL